MKIFGLVIMSIFSLTAMTQPINKNEQVSYLALGDSYTIGESVPEHERWPVQLVKLLNAKGYRIEASRIIATTGWRTDDLKNAVDNAGLSNDYGLVSLLIGVNNQYQGKSVESYKPEFEGLLKKAIELAGGRKERVFVVSIPDYGFTPFGEPKKEEISKAIDAFNQANREITLRYGIRYYYITDLTRKGLEQPHLVAADKLHPSGAMYTRWAELIASDF
ncbi:MAG: SGNH/GDSL hydrolase family protein [Flammeovirgaceae bacterium]|nr:MAG: SGNH/GDSL hydrolase family protein [Flammeovirgaceae bacterium]